MKYLIVLACFAAALSGAVKAEASRIWLVNGGGDGASDQSGTGPASETTKPSMGLLQPSVEFSLKSALNSLPSDIIHNRKSLNEPSQTRRPSTSPKILTLFKPGINLYDSFPNLTLRLGGGNALQNVMNYAADLSSRARWQLASKDTDQLPVGFIGLQYRLKGMGITAGYNTAGSSSSGYKNQKGVVVGVGWSW